MADPIIVSNRSMFWEFLASIATIQGDLSNITAPPFVLAEHSTVELPQYWADHPSLFVAPALAQTPARRALLVLKWFLGSLKNQQYAGRKEQEGVKKPLNAFLGELFLGGWTDGEIGDTRLVAEQVSHHPPITACYLWNEQCGIRAEGFTQQEITFSGTVNIKQKGYAILHIDRHDEDYLIPVPNVKVKGILSGTPYPELTGKYEIVSSTGFVSEVIFEGRGLIMGGTKNGFRARVFNTQNPAEDVYTAKGSWNGGFTIEDATTGETVERCDVEREPSIPITVEDIAEQDPWESRKAWRGVSEALRQGNMRATSNAKSLVEQGQRQMRRDEKQRGAEWKTLFFRRQEEDAPFERLSKVAPDGFSVHRAGGIWKVDREAIEKTNKPYHGDLVPTGAAEPRSAHAQASIGEMNGIPTAKSADLAVPPARNSHGEDAQSLSIGREDAQSLSIGREDAQSSSIGRGDLEKPENIQVEEFLRHKYNSNPR